MVLVTKLAYERKKQRAQEKKYNALMRKTLRALGKPFVIITWADYIYTKETETFAFGYAARAWGYQRLHFSRELHLLERKDLEETLVHEMAHLFVSDDFFTDHGPLWLDKFQAIAAIIEEFSLTRRDARARQVLTPLQQEILYKRRANYGKHSYSWNCSLEPKHRGVALAKPSLLSARCNHCAGEKLWVRPAR